MPEQLPTWLNVGVEPPESLKTNGWQPGMKPSAQHMNWLFNRAYAVLKELQDGGNISEIEQKLTTLERDFATHKAENISSTSIILRNVNLPGVQEISLPNNRTPQYVMLQAFMLGTKKQSTSVSTINLTSGMYSDAKGNSYLSPTYAIVLEESNGNLAAAKISGVKGKIMLNWEVIGAGAGLDEGGQSSAYILAHCIYHGDREGGV